VSRFELRTGARDERTIRLRAPSARRVEIVGDFTRWQAVSLSPAGDGWWTVTLPIAAGTYQANIRVDGGAWLVPPGATALADEDGGIVGVLVLPGR
jgi:1,4-alpha-glucan branching enzyme